MATSGGIKVTNITPTGYTIKALSGHPDFPGSVAFDFSKTGDTVWLNVSGQSAAPIPGGSMGLYEALIYNAVWQPFAKGACVTVLGGAPNGC